MKTKDFKDSKNVVKATALKAVQQPVDAGQRMDIPIELVDLSPLNYRKYFSQEALAEFAGQLLVLGILQNVTVRKVGDRYELVAGERRYRAAKIAGIAQLPAVVKSLTDEQVMEIQLAENIQRENPHPMHEAQAMAQLEKFGKSFEEIAQRLCVSKSTVYKRLRLNNLTPTMQDLFLADKVTLVQANEIAQFGVEEQARFETLFTVGFNSWQYSNLIEQLKADLKKALFDISDKKLLPSAGSCVDCPFNTAFVGSLFPESEEQARCTKNSCFTEKTAIHCNAMVNSAIGQFDFSAIVAERGNVSKLMETLKSHERCTDVPVLDYYKFEYFLQVEPKKEEFFFEYDGETSFDGEQFDDAVENYREQQEKLRLLIKDGKAVQCLYVYSKSIAPAYAIEKSNYFEPQKPVSAKEVQVAIKEGTATPELLEKEILRLESKEKRSKELDREKVQEEVYSRFYEQNLQIDKVDQLTKTDTLAVRWLVFDALGHNGKSGFLKSMNLERAVADEKFFEVLIKMTDKQFCQMVRLAISYLSGCKIPTTTEGKLLYKVAQDSGIDVKGIEKGQQAVEKERVAKKDERIKGVRKQIDEMRNNKKAA